MTLSAKTFEKLLKGELKPPNTMVAYFIEQMQKCRNQFSQIVPRIQELEKELTILRGEAEKVNTNFQKYQEDIKNFWEKE